VPVIDRRTLLVTAALAAAIGLMYAGVLSSLVRQWGSDDNYSHGFFVVPLALYFAWERRAALAAAPVRPGLFGAVVILGSLVVWAAGVLGSELFLTRVSLIGLIAGTVWFVWGRRHLRILIFPILFLLLMIPLPSILFNQLAFPLQLVAGISASLGSAPVSRSPWPPYRSPLSPTPPVWPGPAWRRNGSARRPPKASSTRSPGGSCSLSRSAGCC
jgi:hypothetical protein